MVKRIAVVVFLLAASSCFAQESTLFDEYLVSEIAEELVTDGSDERTLVSLELFADLRRQFFSAPKVYSLSNRADSSLLFDLRTAAFFRAVPLHRRDKLFFQNRIYYDPNYAAEEEYITDKYRGSPIKTTNRLRVSIDDLTFALVQSKDAGETLLFDHLGGYAATNRAINFDSIFFINSVVLGDYSLSYGEGLLLANGMSRMKSADPITPLRPRSVGIRPYFSSSVYQFFRGAAVSFTTSQITFEGFYSDKMRDASIRNDTVTSLGITGYHRTASEQLRRNSLGEEFGGVHIGFVPLQTDSTLFSFGTTLASTSFDKTVGSTNPLQTRFVGTTWNAYSLDAKVKFFGASATGEFAVTTSKASSASAFSISTFLQPFGFIDAAVNYRYLPEEFVSLYGTTFGDATDNAQNERGLYLGLRKEFFDRSLVVEGYSDISSRTERSDSITFYPKAHDFRLTTSYAYLNRIDRSYYRPFKASLGIRYRMRQRLMSDALINSSTFSLRSFVSYSLTKHLEFGAKFQMSSITNDTTASGLTGVFYMRYSPLETIRVETGISLYSTDNFDTRQFIAEQDITGTPTFIQQYGDGSRWFLKAAVRIGETLSIHAKYASSSYQYNEPQHVSKDLVSAQIEIQL